MFKKKCFFQGRFFSLEKKDNSITNRLKIPDCLKMLKIKNTKHVAFGIVYFVSMNCCRSIIFMTDNVYESFLSCNFFSYTVFISNVMLYKF